MPRLARLPLAAALAATLALPAAAQIAPVNPSAAEAARILNQSRDASERIVLFPEAGGQGMLGQRPGTMPVLDAGRGVDLPSFGGSVGQPGANSFGWSGPYRPGDCPSGTIITPFGTCAVPSR
jgi:hypothetical protein